MKPLTYEFIDPDKQIGSAHFIFVKSFLEHTKRTNIGWHYITDIAWIYSQVKDWPRDFKILDAGGGGGPVQFLLAEMGFHVTNIDMVLEPSPAYVSRYQTKLETLPSFVPTSYQDLLVEQRSSTFTRKIKDIFKHSAPYKFYKRNNYAIMHKRWRSSVNLDSTPLGSVQWRIGNLCDMPEIPSDHFDAVVSLSAWEHIPYDSLNLALTEISRVLKPDARWAVTTSGTEQPTTWWHEPSQSNCFAVVDLEKHFGATSNGTQNPAEILEKYRQCNYLKDNLAEFYKKSGKYGMPWGIWEPKYIPLGLSR
jgi:2-polyprenyl-3-methyl-5-hydroxy-6-metoxy-1,4-benzoquinol methylase